MAEFLFYFLAALAIGSGIAMITNRNPVYSVLLLVINFFCIGGLYLLLDSEFLAVTQIIVYAGAIMVLFLFVVMLLNLGVEQTYELRFDTSKGLAFIIGLAFLAEMLYALADVKQLKSPSSTFAYGKVESVGMEMMTNYLFPFEMVSVVLLAAMIGALIIARKHN